MTMTGFKIKSVQARAVNVPLSAPHPTAGGTVILGALVAGYLFPAIGLNIGSGIVGSIIAAVIGAVIVLVIVGAVKRAA